MSFVLTTCLEFADRYEGQIFHVGSVDECRSLADAIPAICYSGGETILNSGFKLIPLAEFDNAENGLCWTCPKAAQRCKEKHDGSDSRRTL